MTSIGEEVTYYICAEGKKVVNNLYNKIPIFIDLFKLHPAYVLSKINIQPPPKSLQQNFKSSFQFQFRDRLMLNCLPSTIVVSIDFYGSDKEGIHTEERNEFSFIFKPLDTLEKEI